MWTAKENAYRDAFLGMLDWWIIRNNATADNPPDFRSKFNADGTFWAWEYEKNRSPAQFQSLMNQVKSERIILPMNPLILTYGCIPAEAAIRGMYYAGELQRRFDLPMDMAMSMENQVMPLGTASLWRGCGAKYAWHGICNCATKLTGLDKNRDKEIYWYKGLDDQKILMKW
jgi:alpha-mannosidase